MLTRLRATGLAAIFFAALALPGYAPAPALASDCNPAAPKADLQLTQTIRQQLDGSTVVALNIVNLGPCNSPDVVLTDILPPGITNLAPQSAWGFDPNSWRCPGPPYETVQVPASSQQGSGPVQMVGAVEVSCSLTATLGVPQTASVDIVVSPHGWTPLTENVTNHAKVSFDPTSTSVDPTLGDNESWAGLLLGTTPQTILDGTQPNATAGILQTTQVTFSTGGGGTPVQFQQGIHQFQACDGGGTIGQVITIQGAGVGGVKTLVFSYDSALNLPATPKIGICSTASGSPQLVPSCTSPPTIYPCVFSGPKKFELGGGEYFVQIVVLTTETSDWWG